MLRHELVLGLIAASIIGGGFALAAQQIQPATITEPQEVRRLPGKLNKVPVFNSNSPEIILNEGILLSTFAPGGMKSPSAHLNYPLSGRFDIFTHHIANAINAPEIKTVYEGLLIHNDSPHKVTVDVLHTSSYLSQPDAPFVPLPAYVDNESGTVFAGPGDRITNEALRQTPEKPSGEKIILEPNETKVLASWPIPVKTLEPPLNGRSTLIQLRTNGPVDLANLATFAKVDSKHQDVAPNLDDWLKILKDGDLAQPREKQATTVGTRPIVFGRVAGIAEGNTWSGTANKVTIPEIGKSISYVVATVDGGTWGTGQIQSAPLLVRYEDTAYQAHGNYAVRYALSFPLTNPASTPRTVTLALQTPLKSDNKEGQLSFFDPVPDKVFFRGTFQLSYDDDNGKKQSKYVHIVQKRGQRGEPLVTLRMKPKSTRTINVEFLYPPDSSPPQVITIKTLNEADNG